MLVYGLYIWIFRYSLKTTDLCLVSFLKWKNGVNKVLKIQLSFTRNIGNTHYVTHVHMNWEQTKPTGVIFKGFYVTFCSQHMLVEKRFWQKSCGFKYNFIFIKKQENEKWWKVMKRDEKWWKIMQSDEFITFHHFSSLFITFHFLVFLKKCIGSHNVSPKPWSKCVYWILQALSSNSIRKTNSTQFLCLDMWMEQLYFLF